VSNQINAAYLPFLFPEGIYAINTTETTEAVATTGTSVAAAKAEVASTPAAPSVKASPKPAHTQAGVKFLGGNKQHILYLIDVHTASFEQTQEFTLLLNMVKAVQLNLPDVAIVNYFEQKDCTIKTIIDELHPQKIICFGQELHQRIVPKPEPYKAKQFGSATFIGADDLATLAQDRKRKQALWRVLKQEFEL
jgi:hypothetical protein